MPGKSKIITLRKVFLTDCRKRKTERKQMMARNLNKQTFLQGGNRSTIASAKAKELRENIHTK